MRGPTWRPLPKRPWSAPRPAGPAYQVVVPVSAFDPFRLACMVCGWRPAADLEMGVAAAHFETEHNMTEPSFELIVVCDRCDQKMTLFATIPHGDKLEHHWHCESCRRGRVIRQRAGES